MPGSPELDCSSLRAMYQSYCPDHTIHAQPATVVRGWGEGGLLSLANAGNIPRHIKHTGVTRSIPVLVWWYCCLSINFLALLQSFYFWTLSVICTCLEHESTSSYVNTIRAYCAVAQEWKWEARKKHLFKTATKASIPSNLGSTVKENCFTL